MYVLTAEITIAKYKFTQIVNVEIESTTRLLSDTATIELPLSAVLENTQRLSLEKEIKRGDEVLLKLGYDNSLNTEFEGYVTDIKADKTLKITCEDKMYSLRKSIANKGFKNTTLKEILSYLSDAFKFDLNSKGPGINLDAFIIKNLTGLQVLEKLKKDYGLTIFFDKNKELYAGLAYVYKGSSVKYDLALNVVKSDLTFKKAEDIQFKIKAISILKNNERLEIEIGDTEGDLRTLYFKGISSETELEQLANEEIQKYKYDGYEGKLTAFGLPFTQVGSDAKIVDENYPGREGVYYVESVKTSFGQSGYRRNVELGIKL